MPEDGTLPPPDKVMALADLARAVGANPVRLQRRARAGLLDVDKAGKTYITTLRRLVDSWDRRGARGPAPEPLPPAIILHVHGHGARDRDG